MVDNLTIQNANTNAAGGAFWIGGATLIVTNSTIRNNHSSQHGGAIDSLFAQIKIINSTISGNSADGVGGAFSGGSAYYLTNSSVIGNHAGQSGGGLSVEYASIQNSRITDNTANEAAAISYTTLEMTESCIQDNVSVSGFDIDANAISLPPASNLDGNWWGAPTDPNTPGADTVDFSVSNWLETASPSCNLNSSSDSDPKRVNGSDDAPPVVVYHHVFEDGEGLVFYSPFGGEILIVTPDDIAAVPECPVQNTLIAANEDVPVWLYRLSTCWFQVNAFTSEGKLYTLIFDQLDPGRQSISFEEWLPQDQPD